MESPGPKVVYGPEAIELNDGTLYGNEVKGEGPDPEPTDGSECTALVPYVPSAKTSYNLWPHLIVQMPSAAEIGTRALTTLVIDLPIYTAKSLYASPIPTLIALYAILPAPVWQVLFPRLLRFVSIG
jgi:hypothetical protein